MTKDFVQRINSINFTRGINKLKVNAIYSKLIKKTTSVILAAVMLISMLPKLPVLAETANSNSDASFRVITYNVTARIDMPNNNTATSYQVFVSTESSLNIATATKVFDSTTYTPFVYAENLMAGTTYYFYYVINNADTATANLSAKTTSTAVYWTSPGNYDTSWYSDAQSSFTISTARELAGLSYLVNYQGKTFLGKTINLNASVDMSEFLWKSIGNYSYRFKGSFNGGNNDISGLHIYSTNISAPAEGLFAYVGLGIANVISNVSTTNGRIRGTYNVAGIVGSLEGATISNSHNSMSIIGSNWFVGGIVGTINTNALISNCNNSGFIYSAECFAGGIVGYSVGGTINNCYNTGNIRSDNAVTGGIVGRSMKPITNCYNSGLIEASGYNGAGGIAGESWGGIISNCYNTGRVNTTAPCVGGITGFTIPYSGSNASIINCYNTAHITASGSAGGIAGENASSVLRCYNIGQVSGGVYIGGIAGNCSGSYSFSDNYYCGASKGSGMSSDPTGVSPLISYSSTIGKGRYTTITELPFSSISQSFKDAFGITGIKYPEAYSSSNTDIVTIDGRTITGINTGNAYLNGVNVAGANMNITISQNALNMTDTSSGFSGAGTEIVSEAVRQPITVNNSTSGSVPIIVTPSFSSNPILGDAVSFGAAFTGESNLSGKLITFSLKDALNNPVTLNQNSAYTLFNGIATLENAWTPTAVGTYTLTASYSATDGTTKTGTSTITIAKKTPTLSMNISPATSAVLGTSLTITPSLTGAYGVVSPDNYEYYIDNIKYTSENEYFTFTPSGAKTYSIYIKYVGDDNNIEATSSTASYTVGKATPTITLENAESGNTYNGSAFNIGMATLNGVSGVTAPTGTITYTYYIDNACTTQTTEQNSGAAVNGGAPVNAGTYYAKAFYLGDDKYNSVTSAPATLVIDKKEITVTGLTATDRAYDGTTAISLTGGTLSGIVGTDNVTAILPTSGTADKNAGTNKDVIISTILLSGTKAGNYTLTMPTIKVDISAATLNAAITPNNKVYDGTASAAIDSISYTGKIGTEDVAIAGGNLIFSNSNVASDINVTASGFTLSGENISNYKLGTVSVTTANISKRPFTITPDMKSKLFGQSDPTLTYIYSGNLTGEIPAFSGVLARAKGETVGNYLVDIGDLILEDNGTFKASNYAIALSSTPVNFTITEYNPNNVNASATPGGQKDWFTGEVTLSAPSGYKISNSNALSGNTWTNQIALDNADSVTKSATYYLKNDVSGAITVKKIFSYKVDTICPSNIVAKYETNNFIKFLNTVTFGLFFDDTLTVTLTADDATSGVKDFTVTQNGGESFTVQNNSTFQIEPQFVGNFSVLATDNAGNKTENIDSQYITVDSEIPSVPTVSCDGYAEGSWTANDVTLTVNGCTADSGIAKYQYSSDNGEWIDMTTTESTAATVSSPYNATKATLTVNAGQHNYQFRAVSGSGMNGTAGTGVSVKIDKVKPIISVSHTPSDLSMATESNVVFTLSNTASNISSVTYYVQKDTGEFTPVTGNTYTINTTDNSTYTFKAVSGANLESTVSSGYIVDVVKPVYTQINVNTNGYNEGNWTSENVTLTLSGGLNADTLEKYQYSTDTTNWSDIIGTSISVDSNFSGIYYFRAVSRGGSTGSTTAGTAIKVDKVTDFTITAIGDTETICQSSMSTLSISGIGPSSLAKIEVKKDNGNFSDITSSYKSGYPITSNGSYVFMATNGAGVQAISSALEFNNIDIAKPTVSVDSNGYIGDTWANGDVIITVSNGNTANLGTATYKFSDDNGTTYQTFNGSFNITSDTNTDYFFKVVSQSGIESEPCQIKVKRDATVPTGTVTIGTSKWEDFLHTITFGLFFKETAIVTVAGADKLSGVQKTEYFKSSSALTLQQVKAVSSWIEYNNEITEAPADAESFIYYVKLTDNAGNVSYISSDKVTFDTTLPVIEGITNGGTYYVDQTVTASDINLDTITLNGSPFENGSKLIADSDATCVIVATDKAGNSLSYTVYTKAISSIEDNIDALKSTNVKFTDKTTVEAVLATVNTVLGTTNNEATQVQIDALNAIKDNVTNLLNKINEIKSAIADVGTMTTGITPDNIKSTDKDTLKSALDKINDLLDNKSGNLTDSEKSELQQKKTDTQGALAKIQEIADAIVDVDESVADITADNVEKDDRETLENAINDYGKILTDYDNNFTDSEKAENQDKIDSIQEILDILDEVNDVEEQIKALPDADDVTKENACDIENAKVAYDDLTNYKKTLVEPDLETKLNDLIKALSKLLLVDTATGTRVEGVDGTVFDIKTELVVTPIKDTLDEQKKALFAAGVNKISNGQEIVQFYNIQLLLNGQPIQPDGNVKVTMKLTDDMKNYANIKVVFIADDGSVTIIPFERNGDEVSFITDHFSNYGIIGTPVKSDNIPITGDTTPIIPFPFLVVTSLLLVYAVKTKRRYKVLKK